MLEIHQFCFALREEKIKMKVLSIVLCIVLINMALEDVEAANCNRTDILKPFRRHQCNEKYTLNDYVQISIVVMVALIGIIVVTAALIALGKYICGIPLTYQHLVE